MAFSVFVTIFKLHLFNYISIKQLLAEYKKEPNKNLSNQYVQLFIAPAKEYQQRYIATAGFTGKRIT